MQSMRTQNLIDNLVLDIQNPFHLNYWDLQTQYCFHGRGGTKISLNNYIYRVPRRIALMMNAAKEHYDDYDEVLENLNTIRSAPLFFRNPFSRHTRSVTTNELYKSDDLECHVIRKGCQI